MPVPHLLFSVIRDAHYTLLVFGKLYTVLFFTSDRSPSKRKFFLSCCLQRKLVITLISCAYSGWAVTTAIISLLSYKDNSDNRPLNKGMHSYMLGRGAGRGGGWYASHTERVSGVGNGVEKRLCASWTRTVWLSMSSEMPVEVVTCGPATISANCSQKEA